MGNYWMILIVSVKYCSFECGEMRSIKLNTYHLLLVLLFSTFSAMKRFDLLPDMQVHYENYENIL